MEPQSVVERFRETRDPDSFRQIVEEYQDRVFRLVCSILGPWADLDAEEITQDVFLRVYRKIGQFRGECAFGSWLYRVAYTTALNHRKTARIRLPHQNTETLVQFVAEDDPWLDATRSVDRETVVRAIECLPDVYRTVVYSFYWMDASVAEIAETLGAPEGTVKSYLSRARAKLRTFIEGERHER